MLTLFALFVASPAGAENAWRVEPDFGKKKARKAISGAACGPSRCYAINDETHYIQSFKLDDGRIVPGTRVDLLDQKAEIDAEAIAYADGAFYITGSHGLSRKKAKRKPAPFTVFRLRGETVERSTRLGDVIRSAPILRDYAEQPLHKNGANIEGLAARGDTLFFGFRGPSIDGTAYILETSAKTLFSAEEVPVELHALRLGQRIGIRDMAAVENGILLLTGPVNTLPRDYSLMFWNPQNDSSHRLGSIPTADSGRPEGLLLLGERSDHYRVMVFYDGVRNGAPTVFVFEKPPLAD